MYERSRIKLYKRKIRSLRAYYFEYYASNGVMDYCFNMSNSNWKMVPSHKDDNYEYIRDLTLIELIVFGIDLK
jgi:hypothetical protein